MFETSNQEVDLPQLTPHICSIQPFFYYCDKVLKTEVLLFHSWIAWCCCGNYRGSVLLCVCVRVCVCGRVVIVNMILLMHVSQKSWIIYWHSKDYFYDIWERSFCIEVVCFIQIRNSRNGKINFLVVFPCMVLIRDYSQTEKKVKTSK
jgi:hypothetical protein